MLIEFSLKVLNLPLPKQFQINSSVSVFRIFCQILAADVENVFVIQSFKKKLDREEQTAPLLFN